MYINTQMYSSNETRTRIVLVCILFMSKEQGHSSRMEVESVQVLCNLCVIIIIISV